MLGIITRLRGPLAGAAAATLVFVTAAAVAGTGVGGVFNLGESNTVDATTSVSGTVGGNAQLSALNGTTAGASFGFLGKMTSSSASAGSSGVRGVNNGAGRGVYGSSQEGVGVLGSHDGSSGGGAGVEGDTSSSSFDAVGVLGQVTSDSASVSSAGVKGVAPIVGNGVEGEGGIGVFGHGANAGVVGSSDSNPGVSASSYSGKGIDAASHTDVGIRGSHLGSGQEAGVSGRTDSTSNGAVGVLGEVTSTNPGSGSAAVKGINHGTGAAGIGVAGSHSGSGWGVSGYSPGGIGVRGASAGGWAGYFYGQVRVTRYLQISYRTGAPPAADCDEASETGRLIVRTDGSTNLYICRGAAGWIGK